VSGTRRNGVTLVMGLVASFVFGARTVGQADATKSGLPDVASAREISYPMNTTTVGMVSLLLTLDATGTVQNTIVLQDTPPLTAAAQASVQNWKFKAASVHGKPTPALLPVYIVFNPYNPAGTAPVSGGLTAPPAMRPNGGSAVPPQVRLAAYAMYPANTVATGTVVLSVKVDKWGHSTGVKFVQGAPPLTDAAEAVVQQWGFQPATSGGQPVAGRVCIVFVFQTNLS
jgi:TonB family protein